jgi:hypothetical protein
MTDLVALQEAVLVAGEQLLLLKHGLQRGGLLLHARALRCRPQPHSRQAQSSLRLVFHALERIQRGG